MTIMFRRGTVSMNKKEKIIAVIAHSFILISTIIITIQGIMKGAGEAQLGNEMIGIGYFKPFTIDSNVFLGLCSFISLLFYMSSLIHNTPVPDWVMKLNYIGACAVSLTFLTVVFFLGPVFGLRSGLRGYFAFFSGDMFFFHFFNPVLAVVLNVYLSNGKAYSLLDALLSIIPMFIYSIVYVINVVVLKNWQDFYGFTFGGNYKIVPLVLVIMYLASFLIGILNSKLRKLKKIESVCNE